MSQKDMTTEKPSTARNITPQKPERKSTRDWAFEMQKDRELVRGIFRFHEVPGGSMKFVYKKYRGEPVERFTLVDGQVYTLPLGVARHLNKNCWYPVHDFLLDEMGKWTNNQYRIQKKVRRCSFQSLEFVDIEDITPEGEATIYTAEKIGFMS
jgi:hypothetical protein